MPRKRRRNQKAAGLTLEQLIALGDATFLLQRFHHRQAEATGHMITKFEGQIEIVPDIYVVSGAARAELRAAIAKMIEREEGGVNELKRLAALPDRRPVTPEPKTKGAANGNGN